MLTLRMFYSYIFFFVSSLVMVSAVDETKILKDFVLDDGESVSNDSGEESESRTSGQPFLSRDNILAFEEFSWGVRAFHNGYHNGALVNFEKALAYTPKNLLYRTWLGFANYYAGLEDLALSQWQTVLKQNPGLVWLQSYVDNILFRSSPYRDNLERDPWVEREETEGRSGRILRFLGPTSVTAHPKTGRSYVASYANNSVTILDVNGILVARYTGGLVQFNGPWDVIPLDDGRFFVSEFRAKCISLVSREGFRLKSFGSDPVGGDELTSPQYLALSDDSYLYVTDWASRRVVKYDLNGRFIMNIGLPSDNFGGIGHPGGIAVGVDEIYVVDTDEKMIRVFDHFGSHLYDLGKGEFINPEGIRLHKGRYLIVADGKRIISVDVRNRTFVPLSDLAGRGGKIIQTTFDANGVLVVADNRANRIAYLSRLSSLYGGIFVEFHHIVADNFPKVVLEVAVRSRDGQPLRGLQASNFLLYENGIHVSDLRLGSYDNQPDIPVKAALMIETSSDSLAMAGLFSDAAAQLTKTVVDKRNLTTFWVSKNPIEDTILGYNERVFRKKIEEFQSSQWRFDAGLRMAASSLFPRNGGKQAVFFVTTGKNNGLSYEQYQPNELAIYLKNNNIMFFPIYVKRGVRNDFYDMIAKETGGYSIYLYRPQGFNGVKEFIRDVPRGLYTISFTSSQDDDFGRAYITNDLEVVIQRESGKAVSGYFAPLR